MRKKLGFPVAVFAFIPLSALMLSGCYSPDSPPRISGRVVKGVLKNAKVAIHSIGDGQVAATSLAETRTDSKGDYTLEFAESLTGPFAIVATADEHTVMVCDNLDGCTNGEACVEFGKEFSAPVNFKMRAFLPSVPDGQSYAHITPLSEMGAAAAVSSGRLDESVVYANNLKASWVLSQVPSRDGTTASGTILSTRPIDISNASEIEVETEASIAMGFLAAGASYKAEAEFDGNLVSAIYGLDAGWTTGGADFARINVLSQMRTVVSRYINKFPNSRFTTEDILSPVPTKVVSNGPMPSPAPPSSGGEMGGGGGGGGGLVQGGACHKFVGGGGGRGGGGGM